MSLHQQILDRIAPTEPFSELAYEALRAVVELCVDHQAEATDGSLTDVESIPPSAALAVIARELGVQEADRDN